MSIPYQARSNGRSQKNADSTEEAVMVEYLGERETAFSIKGQATNTIYRFAKGGDRRKRLVYQADLASLQAAQERGRVVFQPVMTIEGIPDVVAVKADQADQIGTGDFPSMGDF